MAVRQTSPSPEMDSVKAKKTGESPYATIGDITKKVHALKKAFKAIEDHTLTAEQTNAKELHNFNLRMKKQELLTSTLQEMIS